MKKYISPRKSRKSPQNLYDIAMINAENRNFTTQLYQNDVKMRSESSAGKTDARMR